MSDYDMPKEKTTEDEADKDETYYPHLKREIYFNVICDHSIYKDLRAVNPLVARWFRVDHMLGLFEPILYVSDFWHLKRDLILLDKEAIERIEKVRSGEEQEGKEGDEEWEKKKLNFDGNITFNFNNFYLSYL